jgi:hypothetical protein
MTSRSRLSDCGENFSSFLQMPTIPDGIVALEDAIGVPAEGVGAGVGAVLEIAVAAGEFAGAGEAVEVLAVAGAAGIAVVVVEAALSGAAAACRACQRGLRTKKKRSVSAATTANPPSARPRLKGGRRFSSGGFGVRSGKLHGYGGMDRFGMGRAVLTT